MYQSNLNGLLRKFTSHHLLLKQFNCAFMFFQLFLHELKLHSKLSVFLLKTEIPSYQNLTFEKKKNFCSKYSLLFCKILFEAMYPLQEGVKMLFRG